MKQKWMFYLLMGFLMLTPVKAKAQFQIGGGLFVETWFKNVGLDIRAQYEVLEHIYLAAKLDLNVPDFSFNDFRTLNELGIHAQYMLLDEDVLKLYPLAGLSVLNYIGVDPSPVDVDFNLAWGISAGAGGILKLSDRIEVFGEGRYTIGRYHRLMATAGILFAVGQSDGDSDRDGKQGRKKDRSKTRS